MGNREAFGQRIFMQNGWIKLHRKLLDNPLATRPQWAWLWIVLLLLAGHDDKKPFIWNGKPLELGPGQFITGRKKLSLLTGISESTVEDVLRYLESQQQIRQQKTTKYRVITILNWKDYQKPDNKATTDRQQTDTIKNIRSKEVKNKEAEDTTAPPTVAGIPEVIDSFKDVNPAYRKWFARIPQRDACKRLIESHGLEQVLSVVKLLEKTNKMQYFPTITTPMQLEDKWAALKIAFERKKGELEAKDWRNNIQENVTA
jgi:DNA-binding transcriptional regulator YhcF (GntR family)